MDYTLESAIPILKNEYGNKKYKINIFFQFFIHPNEERYNEILFCLDKNVQNTYIDKIYLLNERIYTSEELGGIISDKIIQVNINKRLAYKDVFNYIDNNNVNGFFCIINSDIFFDETLEQLHLTNLAEEKYMFAQLRLEYNNTTKQSIVVNQVSCSQDAWIFHTNFTKDIVNNINDFNFFLGIPGCDNKILFLLKILDFKIINHPDFIKTHHYHTTQIRNYTEKDRLSRSYVFVKPINYFKDNEDENNVFLNDNKKLYEYIKEKLIKKEKFIIPSFVFINEIMFSFKCFLLESSLSEKDKIEIFNFLKNMKNKPNIIGTDCFKYYKLTLSAFKNCDLYAFNYIYYFYLYTMINDCGNNFFDDFLIASKYIIEKISSKKQSINPFSQSINLFSLENINFMYELKWTHAIENKRILIISSFFKKIKLNISSFGYKYFPNCEFIIIDQPTINEKYNFFNNFELFCKQLDEIKENYDIALVSCNNCSCLMTCNYIYENHNKSVISINNVQYYFGIL